MKKIVVLGSTGMAGHVVATYLEENGYEVYRVSRSEKDSGKSKSIDVCDVNLLSSYLDKIMPDAVVNCIGMLIKDSEERSDLAILINSYLPHFLENKYKASNTKVIHLSTDCVFSGESGNYTEESWPDGKTMYDRSKTLGEIVNKKDLTFRMSIIGPDINPKGEGLFNWFLKQTGTVKGYSRVMWNGVTTIELAKAIKAAMEQNISGLYHLTPHENISKYDLLILFKQIFKKDEIKIEPYEDIIVNKTLVNTRTDFNYIIPQYFEMLFEMKEWMDKHSIIYWNKCSVH